MAVSALLLRARKNRNHIRDHHGDPSIAFIAFLLLFPKLRFDSAFSFIAARRYYINLGDPVHRCPSKCALQQTVRHCTALM